MASILSVKQETMVPIDSWWGRGGVRVEGELTREAHEDCWPAPMVGLGDDAIQLSFFIHLFIHSANIH